VLLPAILRGPGSSAKAGSRVAVREVRDEEELKIKIAKVPQDPKNSKGKRPLGRNGKENYYKKFIKLNNLSN
jgi:hypothetical protein